MASGHVGGFNDPLMDCKACKARFRADKLIEDWAKANGRGDRGGRLDERGARKLHRGEADSLPDLRQARLHRHPQVQHDVQDPSGRDRGREQRDLSAPRDRAGHLRQLPERRRARPAASCRSASARSASRFRNEITPGNFIFRIREFEQMELEFFCKPGTDLEWFSYWRDLLPRVAARAWVSRTSTCACATTSRRSWRIYSKATTDFEYLFPFGWGELWGVADRTDFDLKAHQTTSGKSMEYLDPTTGEKYHSVCHRAVPRRGSRGAGLPLRGLRGAGAGGRRHPRRHALPSGARAVQVRRAAAAKEQAAARRPAKSMTC